MPRNTADQPSRCLPLEAGSTHVAPTEMALPPCAWRGPIGKSPQFTCLHPQVHVADHLVDREICSHCRFGGPTNPDWTVLAGRPTVDRTATREPRDGLATEWKWQWAVGITTAPRRVSTLERCLQSVGDAGWNEVRLFAEPGVELSHLQLRSSVTWRDQTLGAFPNWYLGLSELVMRHPAADAFFMIQDDAVFSVGLRAYLEQILWPTPTVGVISVYCPSHYSRNQAPGLHSFDLGARAWGALGYVFPNDAVRCLLSSPQWVEHRQFGPAAGLRNIDTVVGLWCQQSGKDYFVHVPSLAQHIGGTSTLYPEAVAAGRRCASDFVPDAAMLVHDPDRGPAATFSRAEPL